MVYAAVDLLEMSARRVRLWPGPINTRRAAEHRVAVERTLTAAELAVVDRVLAGDLRGCVAGFLADELGGHRPDGDELAEALETILGREPRYGW